MRINRFDHITIAVENLDQALDDFKRLFNLDAVDRRQVPHLGMENAFIPLGEAAVELASPLADSTVPADVRKTLDRRGEGMMNLCLSVDDLGAAILHLEKEGARIIRAKDADGDDIVFIHPRDAHGVLVELRTGKRHIREE
jgi:methylmalonyl-CoA/ethylmalonyl-CoA epimerase